MALDNYESLKATTIEFTGRDDLSALFDTFLVLAEEQIYNNDVQPLRLRSMEKDAVLVTVAGVNSVDLPASFLEDRSLNIESGGQTITLGNGSINTLGNNASGAPRNYAIKGTAVIFDKTPDGVYTLNLAYYEKPTPLSTADPINAILANHPSIYLNGCVSSVYDYATELQDSDYYLNKMVRAIRGAMKNDRKAQYSSPVAKVRGSTP